MKYKIDFINSSYRRSYAQNRTNILTAIDKCYKNGDFVLRAELAEFEKNLAKKITREEISQAAAPTTNPKTGKIIPAIPTAKPDSIATGTKGKIKRLAGRATSERLWK